MALSHFAWSADLKTVHIKDVNGLIEQNRGKVLILNFFATWCPPCREEIPELNKVEKTYRGKDVAFYGLSVDEEKNLNSVKDFVRTMKVNYPVYMAGRDLLLRFGIESIPHIVFYDRTGNMVISQPGQCDADDLKSVIEDLLGN